MHCKQGFREAWILIDKSIIGFAGQADPHHTGRGRPPGAGCRGPPAHRGGPCRRRRSARSAPGCGRPGWTSQSRPRRCTCTLRVTKPLITTSKSGTIPWDQGASMSAWTVPETPFVTRQGMYIYIHTQI
eukprot:scaffold148562_cov17-Prasinocladus_malaysianus.AAC.1